MDIAGIDCGCGTRKETIGSDKWWTGVIIVSSVVFLALVKGGAVTQQTKNMLRIGAAGAVMALIADKVVNPKLKP